MLSSMLVAQGGQSDIGGHRDSPLSPHSAWNTTQTRAHHHQPSTGNASALASNPYSQHQDSQSHGRAPQRLPSPPEMEEQKEGKKFSLPGINHLLTDFPRDGGMFLFSICYVVGRIYLT